MVLYVNIIFYTNNTSDIINAYQVFEKNSSLLSFSFLHGWQPFEEFSVLQTLNEGEHVISEIVLVFYSPFLYQAFQIQLLYLP